MNGQTATGVQEQPAGTGVEAAPVPVAGNSGEQVQPQNVTPMPAPGEQVPAAAAPEQGTTGGDASLLQKIRGLGANKGQLLAERDSAQQRAQELEQENARLDQENAQLREQNGQLLQERQEIEAALNTSREEHRTAGEQAMAALEQVGFPPADLPAPDAAGEAAPKDVLEEYEAMEPGTVEKRRFLEANKAEILRLAKQRERAG